jgi:TolB-like protein
MKKRRWIKLLSLFLFWSLITSSALAGQVITKDVKLWAQKAISEEKALQALEAQNTVAVLYFQNRTKLSELDPLQKGIALMLTTDLSKVKGIQVIERVKLQALVEELAFGVSGLVEPSTAPRVGKLLGARWLIGGAIFEGGGDQIAIRSDPLDVPTQKILGELKTEGKLPDLFSMEKDLLFEIIKLLKIEISPEEEVALRRPCSTNIKALMALFKGIEASDRRNYEKAAEFYAEALKEDPDICIGRDALKELEFLKLLPTSGRSRSLLRSLREGTSLTDQLTPTPETKREERPNDLPAPRPCLNCPK